ncbi:hypothetical protein L6Q85_09775 [bacterium]|nr:hypothetical protein [bacterium]MCK6496532.1 hypothetical protein [bacterium]NUP92118.1 hypothetical protein [Candidatus Omnitrophota bacterium]
MAVVALAAMALVVIWFMFVFTIRPAQVNNLWSESPNLELRGHKDALECIRFSPSGERLLSTGNDGFVRVWDVSNGKLLHEYEIHKKATYVNHAEFLSEKEIVSCGEDGTIRKYNLETKAASFVIRDMSVEVLSLSIIPKRSHIVSEGAAALRIWSATSGQLLQTVAEGVLTRSIVASATGDFVLAGRYDGYVQYWNLENNTTETVYDDTDNLSICLSPSHPVAYVGGGDGLIRVFEVKPLRISTVVRNVRKGSVYDLCFDRRGKNLLWCVNDNRSSEIVVFDVNNRKSLWKAVCQRGLIASVAISPDGGMVAAAGHFGSMFFPEHVVYLWKVGVAQTNRE